MSATVVDGDSTSGVYDAFVCYNSEDQDQALRIRRGLEMRNLRVFEASSDLQPGDDWMKSVASAIAGAKAALVLLGRGGGHRWAELEVGELLRAHQSRRMRIIPVVVPGADGEPDVPFLSRFSRIDLRHDFEANFEKLARVLEDDERAPPPTPRPVPVPDEKNRHNRPLRYVSVAVAVAVAVAAVVGLGIRIRKVLKERAIEERITEIVARGDWPAVAQLADQGSLAIAPLDAHLLRQYHGDGTASAVRVLADMARRYPDDVCPLFARVVGLEQDPSDYFYPELSYEELLAKVDDSPCAARADLRQAKTVATAKIHAALTSAAGFAPLKQTFGPRFDCEALERLRQLLNVPGPRACRDTLHLSGKL